MSAQINRHKRGRSLDQRPTPTTRHRFVTAGVEVEIEEPRSDSEYDSDVIVVVKGRKCLTVSETPPHHAPSALRMLPTAQLSLQLPSSPQAAMETDFRHQALLEWHSPPSNRSCLHEAQVQELRARVRYLEAEAERNIELRAEIHQDFCKVFAEVRELREIVNNLGQQQKLDVFLMHRQEAQWNEFKNTITSQITDEKSHAIERELQLKHELHDVINKKISTKWEQSSDRGERVEQSTTTPMEGVAIDGTTKPTIEEFWNQAED
jgi:hypothetical protein